MRHDVEGVPLDAAQGLGGQDHVVPCRRREDREPDGESAHARDELHHLTAVHVEPQSQVGELAQHLLCGLGGQPCDLDGKDRLLVPLRPAHHHDVAPAFVLDQEQRPTKAGRGPVRSGRQVHQVRGSEPYRTRHLAVDEVLQPRSLVVRRHRHAVDRHRAAVGGGPVVEGGLHVHVLEGR